MNSNIARGIVSRNKILTYVREKGGATTKEIRDNCGNESTSQLNELIDRGQLKRVRRGYYEFALVGVKVK